MRIDIQNAYEKLFWEETKEQIETMEMTLLKIENSNFEEIGLLKEDLNIFYRMAHSIKGTSATMNFFDIRDLAHDIETIVSAILNKKIGLSNDLITLILESIDLLRLMHQQLLERVPLDLAQAIQDWYIKMNSYDLQPKKSVVLESLKLDLEMVQSYNTYIEIIFEEETEMKSVKSYLVIEALKGLGEIIKIVPADYEALEDDTFGQSLSIWMTDSFSEVEIQNGLDHISELEKISVNEYEKTIADIAEPGIKVREKASSKSQIDIIKDSMMVDIKVNPEVYFKISDKRLDLMMSLIEEQIMVKSSLGYSIKQLEERYTDDSDVKMLNEHYETLIEIINGMRTHFLEIRMIPIGSVLKQFSRMIRELAKECQKKVDFYISGGEIEIDRNLLEKIVDPLTHILRNAVDHGLETEAERIILGKPIRGTIKLNVYHEEGKIIIVVEDDGSGIQREKVLSKALENGLIESEEIGQIDIEGLIFKQGISTAQKVSKISGRGVGLEIVKHNIESLNGRIKLTSKEGLGTRFTVELPQNMTIFKALLFKQNDFLFAIPFHWIIEIMRVEYEANLETLSCDHGDYKILKLNQILEFTDIVKKYGYLILLKVKENQFALQVESIIGEQEIVFRSLHEYIGENKILGNSTVINGVTFLGNGDLAYVLDPNMVRAKLDFDTLTNTIFSGVDK